MIIWGSRGKTKVLSQGEFLCPVCRVNRPYELKELAKYFTLYFIPLFQTESIAKYVECKVCGVPFKPEILQMNAQLEEERRKEADRKQLLDSLRHELDAGISIQSAASGLTKAGVPRDVAAAMLYLSIEGTTRKCPSCGQEFARNVRFCSSCGTELGEQKKY